MTDKPDYFKHIPKHEPMWNIQEPSLRELRWQAAVAAIPPLIPIVQNEKDVPGHYKPTHLACCAFAIADAMLKEGGYVE